MSTCFTLGMMSDFRLISIVIIIIISSSSSLFALILVEDSSILDEDFTFKATVECYDGPSIVAKTSTSERYSGKDRRGVVKLLVADEYNRTLTDYKTTAIDDDDKRLEYHYDANFGTWIELIPRENFCINDSQYNLYLHLYGTPLFPKIDSIYESICPGCANDNATKHLIGTARLLAMVHRLRPTFGRPIEISTSAGSHLAMFHLAAIKVGDSASVELFIHYDKLLDSISERPRLVRLHYTPNWGQTYVIVVSFYQFELLRDTIVAEQIQHPFAFPTGMSCSKALSLAMGKNKQPEVRMIQDALKDVSKFSFSARDLNLPSPAIETFYALDLRSKLIRKDQYFTGANELRLTTIYDLKDNIKYNMAASRQDNEDSKGTECVMNKIGESGQQIEKKKKSDEKFINFERLVYLGKARINSIDALIFEEFSTGLQSWIQPPTWASNEGDDEHFRTDSMESVHTYVTYYFALGSQTVAAATRGNIGSLMRVDIAVRDSIQRLVWHRTMAISEFVAGRLIGSHSKSLDGAQMFSLVDTCELGSKSGQVEAILESDIPLQDMTPVMMDPSERNEFLIEALVEDYGIQRTQFEHLNSRLLTKSKLEKTVLELEFSLGQSLEQSLNSIDCVYLGKGQLRRQDSSVARNYAGIATFDDCMWLAHRHMFDLKGEEVLFTYNNRFECFTGRLYGYKSLVPGLDDVLSGSNRSTSLNYHLSEHGIERIFTFKRETKSLLAQSTKGMHFFQVGSLKMIGQILRLPVSSSRDQPRFRFSRVNLSGHLARVYGEHFYSRRISGLSWSEKIANKLIVSDESQAGPVELDAQMSESMCQSHCLLDLSCNSISFCDRLLARPAQCLISSIDVSKTIVMKQLENLKDHLAKSGDKKSSRKKKKKRATIMFDEGSLQQPEVEIVLDQSCSISGKSHSDLFKQTYTAKVEGVIVNSIDRSIRDKDECAKKCFAKNIKYFVRLADHKSTALDYTQTGSENDHQVAWDSLVDSAREGSKELCTGFLYANEISAANKSSHSVNGCLLERSTSSEKQPQSAMAKPDDEANQMRPILMHQHKLIYLHLFRRIPSLRLVAANEAAEFKNMTQYEKLLRSHLRGLNSQIKLPMDDVEFCARTCVMQLNGPRPMCSSFDFVHEQIGNTMVKYCLLNSQSLYHLKHRGPASEQHILHEDQDTVSYWHFEPREAALQIPKNTEPIRGYSAEKAPGAFISISIILKLVSLVFGLLIGIKFTSYFLEASEEVDELLEGRTARRIHRLSGVSLRSNLREIDVQMS